MQEYGIGPGNLSTWFVRVCLNCGWQPEASKNEKKANEAWNTRSTPQQPSEPLKALESDWEIQFDEKFGLKEKMRIYDNAKTAMEKIALKSGGLDFQISYLLCIKEWIRSKFGQPSECLCEDKKETIERRIERKNNNMDKKQFMDKFETFMIDKHAEQYQGLDDEMPDDYSEWLQSLSHDEVCEYIGEFSVLITSFKFPKKIDHKPLPFIVIPKDHELNDLIEHNREVGYNQAIDACKKAYESAMPAQREVRYPEYKDISNDRGHTYNEGKRTGFNTAIDEFKKLNF